MTKRLSSFLVLHQTAPPPKRQQAIWEMPQPADMKKAKAGLPSSAGQFRLESLLMVFCGYSPIKPGKFFQIRPICLGIT
ncbi:hypothetical protein [Azotobacter chroococcum]|uniref:hypothetical protein n=1 Tax=Azotobacter chroococcum TaxID=353 RepID=UPI0013924159|nr:hypothetical protein [Azotobacter chroococcum]